MSPGPAGVVAGGTTSVAAITPGAAPPRPSGIFPMLLCTTHYHPPHPSPMLHGLGKPGPPIPWTEGVSQNPFPADMWGRLSTQKQVLCAAQAGCASTPSCYELAAPDENPHSPSTDGTRLSSPHCTNCGHHPPPQVVGWNLSWLPLSLGLAGWPKENPPLPMERNSIKACSAFQTHLQSHISLFLDAISVPLKMSSVCIPSAHASRFRGVGARTSGGGLGG